MNYLVLCFTAFISATLFPLGSEALLITLLEQQYSIIYLLLFASIGNISGSILNYFLGLKGEEYLVKKDFLQEKHIIKYKPYFDKYGGLPLLLSWMPIIGDPITFVAGILKYDLKKFMIFVTIAKFGRYLFLVIMWQTLV